MRLAEALQRVAIGSIARAIWKGKRQMSRLTSVVWSERRPCHSNFIVAQRGLVHALFSRYRRPRPPAHSGFVT